MIERDNAPQERPALRPVAAHSSRSRKPDLENERLELEQQLLMASAQNHGAKASELLFSEYVALTQRRLHHVSERITCCPHTAQDIVQESCVALYERLFLHNKPFSGCLESWLIGVVANKSITSIRKHKRRKELLLRNATSQSPSATPEDLLHKAEQIALMWNHVSALPSQQRQALTLKYLDDWNWEQIGDFLNITPESARQYCYRALAKVRARTNIEISEPKERKP